MVGWALEYGLTPYELSYFDLGDLTHWVDGRRKAQAEGWRQTRYLAWVQFINNGFVKGKDKPRRPEDLFELDGDVQPVVRTEQELQDNYNRVIEQWQARTRS